MEKKKAGIFLYSSIGFVILMLILLFIFKGIPPSDFLYKILSFKIKSPDPFNVKITKAVINLIFAGILAVLISLGAKYPKLNPFKKWLPKLADFLTGFFTIRVLLVIIAGYFAILFYLAVSRYDLGIDEVGYLIYAKSFAHNGFAYCILNGKFWVMDTYAMLPMYVIAVINFLLGLTEVWHFKLLATLLSLCSLYVIFRITRKLYSRQAAVLFLFLLSVQPGFGFVASSFFGEIVQALFFFSAVYLWLKDDTPMTSKKVYIISLLFAVCIQTKFQVSQSIFLSLIIFHFIDKEKKALPIFFFTVVFVIAIALLRLAPAVIYDRSFLTPYIKFWYGEFFENVNRTALALLDRTQFFNKFLSFIFTVLLMGGIFLRAKKPFEKFISLFTLFYLLWWIVYFWLSNYRVLFIGIITFCFLLAEFIYDIYRKYANDASPKAAAWIPALCILTLMAYGYSINIIYASIGINDAVQFDLDGAKSRLFIPVAYDKSQKEFYREAKNVLRGVDSVYIASGGQACYIPQFYLGESRIFDKDFLGKSVESTAGAKYVIIDRTAFPLGLEEGYKVLDALNVHRTLLLKNGEYELYSVEK